MTPKRILSLTLVLTVPLFVVSLVLPAANTDYAPLFGLFMLVLGWMGAFVESFGRFAWFANPAAAAAIGLHLAAEVLPSLASDRAGNRLSVGIHAVGAGLAVAAVLLAATAIGHAADFPYPFEGSCRSWTVGFYAWTAALWAGAVGSGATLLAAVWRARVAR